MKNIFIQALMKYKNALELKYILTLSIVNNLRNVYKIQGKLNRIKDIYV